MSDSNNHDSDEYSPLKQSPGGDMRGAVDAEKANQDGEIADHGVPHGYGDVSFDEEDLDRHTTPDDVETPFIEQSSGESFNVGEHDDDK